MVAGGYQKPNNPAPASGPGALSERTDGGPTQAPKYISGMPYKQGGELFNQQSDAPMAGDPVEKFTPPQAPNNPMQSMMAGLTPLDAESQDNLPISDGVDIGRGRDSSALPSRLTSSMNQNENVDLIKRYLPDLMNATRLPNTPDSYKRFVNYLKSQIL